nr:hypothetical protein [Tanacetum cinerariifolium]
MREFIANDQANYYSRTHEEDVEHIEYIFKIVDPIDLPNENHDKLRVVIFLVSLAGDAWRWIETNLFDYETSLCEKFKEFNYLPKIDPDFLTKDIEGLKTYDEYKDDWIYKWNKNVPWVHKQPWTDTGDSELKDEALRNKAIMEGTIDDDDESSNNGWRRWDNYEIADHDQKKENMKKDMKIKRDVNCLMIMKDEYDDLTSTSKDACRAYQKIFRMMDEGWMVSIRRIPVYEYGVLVSVDPTSVDRIL